MDEAYLPAAESEAAEPLDRGSSMLPGPFLRKLADQVQIRYAGSGRTIRTFARSRLAQFWFGEYASIHYEVWVHDRTARLEIGLHCEAAPEYNRALYVAFDKCMLEIQQGLGASFWLEEWDHGWIRLYETQPLWPLDDIRVAEIEERLCETIDTLQPLCERFMTRIPYPPATETVRSGRRRHGRERRAAIST